MYQPPLFQEDRLEVMHALMHSHPFATLVTSQNGELSADHIPFAIHTDLSTNGTLRGHVAKGNPLLQIDEENIEALVIFQGPQTYITPSWYPSKQVHGKVVPTWNYAVVHARGQLSIKDDDNWLLHHLKELTKSQESLRESPWKVSDAPENFLTQQFKGIVGIELTIRSLTGKWKVSQNKSAEDQRGVKQGLEHEHDMHASAMAALVGQRGRDN